MKVQRILLIDETRRSEIDSLRMSEYAKASGFVVDLNTLKWRPSDNESYVFAAEEDGEIVTTMRAEILESRELLEQKLECPWDFPIPIEMPVLLLSRAATKSDRRASGLNLLLRYWCIRMAEHYGVPTLVGTFVAGSPRERTLQEMGYKLFENRLGWQQSTYRSISPVTVASLDLRHQGAQAEVYCKSKIPEELKSFRFDESYPERRVVTCL